MCFSHLRLTASSQASCLSNVINRTKPNSVITGSVTSESPNAKMAEPLQREIPVIYRSDTDRHTGSEERIERV